MRKLTKKEFELTMFIIALACVFWIHGFLDTVIITITIAAIIAFVEVIRYFVAEKEDKKENPDES